jgi:hypothetical protein
MTLYFNDLVLSPDIIVDEELFDYLKNWIDQASHFEMGVMERYAPGGHVIFNRQYGLNVLFDKKFDRFGGMNPRLSKQIGFYPIIDTKFNTITHEQFTEIMSHA